VKTPEFPEVHLQVDTSAASLPAGQVRLWKDAKLTEPRGEALSAYGVSLDSRGVAMADVPEFSGARALGFLTGDLVLEVDGKGIGGLEHFIRLMDRPGRHVVIVVRNQQQKELTVRDQHAR
jgi:S1-C subfamily serine protease